MSSRRLNRELEWCNMKVVKEEWNCFRKVKEYVVFDVAKWLVRRKLEIGFKD